ncbi:hypothetical protein AGMMS5026_10420 [Endomicrobiia bacterium]|nr:hypothetical protein AGMMS49523_01690 [Endomicrobiia bacterium]GHT13123.1 hypothetical protein AGMMS49571_06270 [Endomicrobiia bacterium]GHT21635.1 hypothetical protein AGMMS49929_10440 [Endomicrobiia bacterium]GHT27337.1 hypothetical protein AGMMS49995_06090 [Endomicrobiia bacterium]GHT32425.1 hypothetical protein AGMMS5026_10420 [Endomicrobiia bacterium]
MRFLWQLLAKKQLALQSSKDLEKKENSADCETSQKRFPINILKEDPYILRYKALEEKLSLFQLGYVLYHIADHRGTDSVRSFLECDDDKIKENTLTAKIAKETKKVIDAKKYRTFGEYLYKEKIEKFQQNIRKKVSNRKTPANKNKEFAVTRDVIIKETEKILASQKQYYTYILTDEYIKEIKDAISYQTEKLIPESGYCPYFKDEKRLPRSHKLNEYRRMYEALNNAKYFAPVLDENTGEILSYQEKEFSREEKKILFDEVLLKGMELTESGAKKLLHHLPDGCEVQLQGRDKTTQKIKGYALVALEASPFWLRLSQQQQDEFLYDWNSLPLEKLKPKLTNDYSLTESEVDETFQEIKLPSNYASVGKKAMEILLTYIKDGCSYTEALEKAVSEGKLKVDKQTMIYDSLPYYGKILKESTQKPIGKAFSKQQFAGRNYKEPDTNKNEREFGKIANSVVHQTLNELRKLINEIITVFGKKPLEIGLETTRELKKSKKNREYLSKQQNKNECAKNEIYKKYIEPHLSQIKSRQENPSKYISKFELLEEQNFICPFCSEKITPDDIINSKVDVEHIFPIEESEDNTKNNLVIAHNECNADKGKKSPFDAFGDKTSGKYRWNCILHNAKKNLPHKVWRFYQGSLEKFLENKPMSRRFGTDNSYISKIAARYLACLFNDPYHSEIFCIKSSLIAQLRIAWDLNSIMVPLVKNILSEKELEEFKISKNKKIRIDNRHHALDAIVIAYANRGYHNFLNRIHAKEYKINYREKSWLSKILLPPLNRDLEDFKISVKDSIEKANVSIKHDHNTNGSLVKATAYKVYYSGAGEYIITTSKNVEEISFKEKEDPKDTLYRALCKFECRDIDIKDEKLIKKLKYNSTLYKKVQNNLSKAKQELEQDNKKTEEEGKKSQKITEVRIYKKACSLVKGQYIQCGSRLKDKFFAVKEPTEIKTGLGYDTGDNLFLDLYYDKTGKLCGEIIRKVNFNRNKPNYQKEGYTLFERIYQSDILEVDTSEDRISLKNKTGSAPSDRTFIKVNTFTEVNAYFDGKRDKIRIFFGNLLKSSFKNDSFFISSMQKYNVRKVILTSLGIIKYRSQILKNKRMDIIFVSRTIIFPY